MLKIVSLMLIASFANAANFSDYERVRSVKVATLYPDGSKAYGTGIIIDKYKILTEAHIVAIQDQVSLEPSKDSKDFINALDVHHTVLLPTGIEVLLSDSQEFIPAIIITSDSFKDLAILKVKEPLFSRAIFTDEYFRGQSIKVVGNNGYDDFLVINSNIMGIDRLNRDDMPNRTMITLDSKNNTIRHGFSGGPVFNNKGAVIGMIELCNQEVKRCEAISSKDIIKYLKENN